LNIRLFWAKCGFLGFPKNRNFQQKIGLKFYQIPLFHLS